jgi:hypothetical protein
MRVKNAFDWMPAREALIALIWGPSLAVFWRKDCGRQKLPDIRHEVEGQI